MLGDTGERYLPWVDRPQAAYEHLQRYAFAAELAGGRRVLDLASGEGYGSSMLAERAAFVVGVDRDGAAVAHAGRRYRRPNLSFLQGSIEALPIRDRAAFELVVCFEAIEHLQDARGMVREAARLLAAGGLFLLSTPNKRAFTDETGRVSPWHTREFYLDELREILASVFPHLALFGQRVLPGSLIWPLEGSPESASGSRDFLIEWQADRFAPARPGTAMFFLAAASTAALDPALTATQHHLVDVSERLLLEKTAAQNQAAERESYARSLESSLAATRRSAAEREAYAMDLEEALADARRVAEESQSYARSVEEELEKTRSAVRHAQDGARRAARGGAFEDTVACTVISKNYLAQARVLVDSFLHHHPGVRFYVLLADRLDGYFDPSAERFELVELDRLDVPEQDWFRFKYSVIEHDTAVKPYFFTYLFERVGAGKIVYFDPDILVLDRLDEIDELLDTRSALLTPHLTAPMNDGRRPRELDILMAGTYNLGFIALSATEAARAFLRWWRERCYDGCRLAVAEGMHVDQKWVDLAPGLFDGFHVLRRPGYNVAYWNLHERRLSLREGKVWVNGEPCSFFHFSGADPDRPQELSRHQDRFRLSDVSRATRKLFERYHRLMLNAGYEECRRWPYAFADFDNGVRIPELARSLAFRLGEEERRRLGNPFQVASDRETFFSWLNGRAEEDPNPNGLHLSPLLLSLYRMRRDVQEAFPDVFGAHREAFLRWVVHHGRYEHGLDPAFVPRWPGAPQRARVGESFGVNVCGHFASEKGVGEAARSVARALAGAQVPHVLNHLVDRYSANVDRTHEVFSPDNPYPFNIVCVNADATQELLRRVGDRYLADRYNIGVWNWELEWFPEEWRAQCELYDEIWAPSAFTAAAIAGVSPVPVRVMPYALSPERRALETLRRDALGIPPDAFVFLFVFDFQSFVERKNPSGVIRAFQRAFTERDDAALLIKSSHSEANPAGLYALMETARHGNIRILDRVLGRRATQRLFELSDCYVSLHRSEGFGLTLAEAMRAGKPVIATGYSSNLDFMTPENSYLVPYSLRRIRSNHGPYRRGAVWAEPDLRRAADLMRHVYERREEAADRARRARRDVLGMLHPRAVGARVRRRLIAIARERALPAPPGHSA